MVVSMGGKPPARGPPDMGKLLERYTKEIMTRPENLIMITKRFNKMIDYDLKNLKDTERAEFEKYVRPTLAILGSEASMTRMIKGEGP